MESETELDTARNEVLRKIGRNLLMFQQMEGMLKFLLANGQISGYASELAAKREQRTARILKQSMGQLVGQLLEETHTNSNEATNGQEELKETWVSFSFRVEGGATYYDTRKEALSSIVADRNELVHHLLPSFDPSSIESCLITSQSLDRQRERLLPEIENLKGMIAAMREGWKAHASFFSSDEAQKQIELLWLRQSRLAILLGDIASQIARPDGWAALTTAGELIREHAPEEWKSLRERYGQKTLKGLILATELFDVLQENTNGGGIRVFYRLKPEWSLHSGG